MAGKMSVEYLPAVLMTKDRFMAVVANKLPLRVGQWVRSPKGSIGQYVRHTDSAVYVSWAGKGDGFYGRTQRFCRAVWHHKRKHESLTRVVLKAPRSLTLNDVKAAVRNSLTRKVA